MSKLNLKKVALQASLILSGYILLNKSVYYVKDNENAILIDKIEGVKETIYEPGLHLCIPFLKQPIYFNMKPEKYKTNHLLVTKDTQKISLDLEISYKPIKEHLAKLYLHFGLDYEKALLPALANDSAKFIVSTHKADDLIKTKEEVINDIKVHLGRRIREYHLSLEDIKGDFKLANDE